MAGEERLRGQAWLRRAVREAHVNDGTVSVDINTWNILNLYAFQTPDGTEDAARRDPEPTLDRGQQRIGTDDELRRIGSLGRRDPEPVARSCCDDKMPHYHGRRWVPARDPEPVVTYPTGDQWTRSIEAEYEAQGQEPVASVDPLLDSRELPALPWSSAADHQPWPDEAADHHRILDANGKPIFGRNWKEACAAIEYLVRAANRGA